MGAIEEGGKVASSVVEGLKANPSCLAALACVALFGILSYFENSQQNERMLKRSEDVHSLLTQCLDTNRDMTKSITEGTTP